MTRSLPLLLSLVVLSGCHRAGSDEPFQWSSQLPPGAVLHIRDGAGDVRVVRGSGPSVTIRGSRTWKKSRASDVDFVVESNGADVFVCAMWRNSGKCNAKDYRGRNTSTLLSMLSLFHRNNDATAGFTVEVPANVVVDARTNTGSVDLEGLSAGVTAKTLNGTIRATDISGPMVFAVTNGDVRVSAGSLAPDDSLHFTTTNGSVHAELPAGLQASYDLSVANGSVQSDIPFTVSSTSSRRHVAGQVGTSARVVRMHTVNGQVIVTTRDVGRVSPVPAAPAAPAATAPSR